jgi:hypothetical protein
MQETWIVVYVGVEGNSCYGTFTSQEEADIWIEDRKFDKAFYPAITPYARLILNSNLFSLKMQNPNLSSVAKTA